MEDLLANIMQTHAAISGNEDLKTWALRVSICVILFGLLQNVIYLWCLPQAWMEINSRSQRDDEHAEWEMLRTENPLPISIIVPAYNEQNTIRESVLALLALHYPQFKLIVVNDGSSDLTVDTMIREFEMTPIHIVRDCETISHKPIRQIYGSEKHPDLIFLDKENGKKADAINAGMTCVRTPLFCVIDADSLLESRALLKAVRPFLETSDNVIAVGGTVGIANGCTVKDGQVVKYGLPKRFLPRLQVMEYLRAFLMARLAASRKGTLAIISGAFGIFRRDIAVELGGYDTGTVGEDMELIWRMHRHMLSNKIPYSIRYVPEPVCWTEAPESLKFLTNQRIRWQRGALECLSKHRVMLFNPKYGRLGMVTLPTFMLVDLICPIMEILGYSLMVILLAFGWLDLRYFVPIIAVIFSFGFFIGMMTVFIEQDEIEQFKDPKDLGRILFIAFIENFGYRQLCAWWRIKGLYKYLRGGKVTWGSMERVGFKTTEANQT